MIYTALSLLWKIYSVAYMTIRNFETLTYHSVESFMDQRQNLSIS